MPTRIKKYRKFSKFIFTHSLVFVEKKLFILDFSLENVLIVSSNNRLYTKLQPALGPTFVVSNADFKLFLYLFLQQQKKGRRLSLF